MLDKQDIKILRDMFGEFRIEVKEMFAQNNIDLKRDIRDEMHTLLKQNKQEIVREISEFLDSAILPQIAELQTDMIMVKRHLNLA